MGVNDRSEQQMAMLDAILVEVQGLRADKAFPERVELVLEDSTKLSAYIRKTVGMPSKSRFMSDGVTNRGKTLAYNKTGNAQPVLIADPAHAESISDTCELIDAIRAFYQLPTRPKAEPSTADIIAEIDRILDAHRQRVWGKAHVGFGLSSMSVNPFTMKRGK